MPTLKIDCPNKNLAAWRKLAKSVGEPEAYLAYFRNGNKVPTSKQAKAILAQGPTAPAPAPIGVGKPKLQMGGRSMVLYAPGAQGAIAAYHGTHAEVPQFSTEKIGTGEGAQVYGWGLYFAGNRATAEYYQKMSEARGWFPIVEDLGEQVVEMVRQSLEENGINSETANPSDIKYILDSIGDDSEIFDAQERDQIKARAAAISEEGSNLYQVQLNVHPDELLDWDKPLSEQSETVKKALTGKQYGPLGQIRPEDTGAEIYGRISEHYMGHQPEDVGWTQLTNVQFRGDRMVGKDAMASAFLHSIGIRGVQYLDQFSRGGPKVQVVKMGDGKYGVLWGNDPNPVDNRFFDTRDEAEAVAERVRVKPTSNYVIFNDKDIRITDKNGQPVQASVAAGQLAPAAPRPGATLPNYKARNVEELKALLPHMGLTEQSERLLREFLNLPVIDQLPAFKTLITDALDNGWQGSKLGDMIAITRGADPLTGPHEILHLIADILPGDLKAELERLRTASINSMIAEAEDAGKSETAAALTNIRDNPTSGADEFLGRNYPAALRSMLYPVSSWEEFFTHSGSKRFQQRVGSTVEGFWQRIKEIIQQIIGAIKRALGLRPNQAEFLDSVLDGRFEAADPEEVAYKKAQGALDPNADDADEVERVPTQIMGSKYYVFDREQITPQSIEASAAHAKEIFDRVGIPVVEQQSPKDDQFPDRRAWIAPKQGRDMTAEGQRLLGILRAEIATKGQAPKPADQLANLINSVRLNTFVLSNTAFSEMDPNVRMELGAIAQGEASYRGAALGSLAGYRKDLHVVGRNLDIELGRIWSDTFGGDDIRFILDELKKAQAENRDLKKALDEANAKLKKKQKGRGPGKGPGAGPGKGPRLDSGTRMGQKIIALVQEGKGEPWEVLKELARLKGWNVPTDADLQRVKDLLDREEALLKLSPTEEAATGGNAEKLALALDDRRLVTLEKRHQLMKEVKLNIARWTKPLNWRRYWATAANNASALNEYAIGNMLLKFGFAVPRLPVHIIGQLLQVHVPTRAIATAIVNARELKGQKIDFSFWKVVHEALRDQVGATVKSWRQATRAFTGAIAGRAETRNVDRLNTGIMLFERLAAKAQEYAARGDYGRAVATWIIHLPKWALRFVQAVDNFQGAPTELAEMRHQVRQFMREDGRSPAEIEAMMDSIFSGMAEKREQAMIDAADILKLSDEKFTHAELVETAWNLVKGRMYQQMFAEGMPADDFRSRNKFLMETLAWQKPVQHGPGGVLDLLMKSLRNMLSKKGIPSPFFGFHNAIGTGVNYMLMNTPFYGVTSWKIPGISRGESPWFATDIDRMQRRVQAIMWSILGAVVIAAIRLGLLKVWLHAPKDKEARALWDAEGHRVGTVEIRISDHEFIPLSLVVGPGALLAPYLAGGAAWTDAEERQAQRQAKMNAEAERLGLTPGKVPPMDAMERLAIMAEGAWGAVMGNKAFSGMVQSGTEFGMPNVKKLAAAQISPFIVGLPGYQEITRAEGIVMDPKLATVSDYLVPLPTSGGRALNMLGEPVGTPDAIQRAIQTMTAGTYPWVVDSDQAKATPAYAALLASGYRPPTINPGRAYVIGGDYRPFTDKELASYTAKRGQYLTDELSELGQDATASQARAAYQRANGRALLESGAEVPTRSQAAPSAQAAGAPTPAAGGVGGYSGAKAPRAITGGVSRGLSRIRTPRGLGARGPRRGGLRLRTTRGLSARVGRGLRIGAFRKPRLAVGIRRGRLIR